MIDQLPHGIDWPLCGLNFQFEGVINMRIETERLNIADLEPSYFEAYKNEFGDGCITKKAIMYLHGKGGTADEAARYREICCGYDVYGIDYKGRTPWETKPEITAAYSDLAARYDSVLVIANSIGAYFAMHALQGKHIEKAFFISPIVNMEKLITDMMQWANVSEQQLSTEGEIETAFGETLSWEYLQYVRNNPIVWNVPTEILYAGKDNLTSRDAVEAFCKATNSVLTVMDEGEHWFHTDLQLAFLDDWIKRVL